MNFRKLLIASSLVLISAGASADTRPLVFTVEANVSNDQFLVQDTGGWAASGVKLDWQAATGEIKSVSNSVYVKSSSAIKVYLEADAVMKDGANSIPLVLSLNSAPLVAGIANAVPLSVPGVRAGTSLPLVISAQKPVGGYMPGSYQSSVKVIFDSTI